MVIKFGDEILLTRRNQEPKKGKLDLAGGFVDPKETAEETCARELFEEMKIKIDISKLKYLASLPNIYEYKNISELLVEMRDSTFNIAIVLDEYGAAKAEAKSGNDSKGVSRSNPETSFSNAFCWMERSRTATRLPSRSTRERMPLPRRA